MFEWGLVAAVSTAAAGYLAARVALPRAEGPAAARPAPAASETAFTISAIGHSAEAAESAPRVMRDPGLIVAPEGLAAAAPVPAGTPPLEEMPWRTITRARRRTMNRLGELERAVMEVLWERGEPMTVRAVGQGLAQRELAHTTVMTVLNRLVKKGIAVRCRRGRAWSYQALATRESYVSALMFDALSQAGDRGAALAAFAREMDGSEADVLRSALTHDQLRMEPR